MVPYAFRDRIINFFFFVGNISRGFFSTCSTAFIIGKYTVSACPAQQGYKRRRREQPM